MLGERMPGSRRPPSPVAFRSIYSHLIPDRTRSGRQHKACNSAIEPKAAKAAPYDVAKLDMKPALASNPQEHHRGALSSGDALSLNEKLAANGLGGALLETLR
jgi:hypothetical protein